MCLWQICYCARCLEGIKNETTERGRSEHYIRSRVKMLWGCTANLIWNDLWIHLQDFTKTSQDKFTFCSLRCCDHCQQSCVENSPPHTLRSKAKANFCICIQPPILCCFRLNFKKLEFTYFFWGTSAATNMQTCEDWGLVFLKRLHLKDTVTHTLAFIKTKSIWIPVHASIVLLWLKGSGHEKNTEHGTVSSPQLPPLTL